MELSRAERPLAGTSELAENQAARIEVEA